ncbi:SpoIIE family protein phosphatase [Solirubrobacter sp. CPCC 204708]|uniref:SpoIIE family protein phosphatase n=1 Tax=Solirubrobacter deserti TaxID=2282478 RepID=A0ABT4RCN7_9ACTN|nr:SpoIIE family protein phosphatase [Solirubrobacter deserti]MBE2315658.1 SpoIIE family protein phosphatase [Solirubrobacter deserti]MDA0136298.1 SpoIIE family protein phosphatase [Solirubrobacter deserti]
MTDLPAVLLVDDREENLIALRAVLEPLPCRLVSAMSGEEALKALLLQDFAVVLLDVQMPNMDGFETAELIKGRARTRTLPIIFVTAISKEREHVFRGYETGAVDYVFKPYDPEILRSKVAVFLELDAKSRAAARSEAILRAAFEDAPIGMARLDLEGRVDEANRALAALLGQRPADLRDRLLDSFVHGQDRRLVADGIAQLDATTAFECEARLLVSRDEPVPCQLSCSRARPGAGMADVIVVQVQDLRERRRAEAERAERVRADAARVEAERTAARLAAIQRISDAALGTLAFDDLVRELLKRIVEALEADTAAVVLNEADGTVVVYQAGEASAPVRRRARSEAETPTNGIQVGSLLAGAVATTLEAPLVVDGQTIGALHVGTLFARSFSSEHEALLRLAADRAATGIQRARLYQREHGIAQELQRSLLPAAVPQLPGFATAARYFAAGDGSQVGGDWYDALVRPDGRLLLLVGDVAGRGIAAAATMGQLRSALRAYALDGHPPAALLERLNAFQVGLRDRGMTTVSIVEVDPGSGALRYAKAGHPPALLVDAEGHVKWLREAAGPPLGALDDPVFTEGTETIEAGGTLVQYSDGLVELRGEPLDVGFDRLAAATIAAPDGIDELTDGVLAGTLANPSAEDDVTLLVLRRDGVRLRPVGEPFPRRRTGLLARQLRAGSWPHERVRSAAVELPGGLQASAAARGVVADTLAGVASRGELDDLLIIVTELVNNAVVHGGATDAGDRVLVHVAAADERLRAEVSSRGAPFELRPPSAVEEPGGFGLLLVDQLSSRWGVDGGDDFCVWFEIDRSN